jgi:uncharacterized protein (DUF488 family)
MGTTKSSGGRVVLYTIGYEGHSSTSLVREIKRHKIARVLDVRLTPQSRQRGMSLTSLYEAFRKAGVQYEHVRDLGNPKPIRILFHEGRLREGRAAYKRLLSNGKASALDLVIALASVQRIAIMCRESDAEECHRIVIAEALGDRDTNIKIVHL